MSPSRTSRRGSFRFDRDFSRIGVGRIQRASGAYTKTEFSRRDGILTKLAEAAQIELLRAFARGEVTIEELVEADREGRLQSTLSDIRARRPLWPALEEALERLTCLDATRRRYAVSLAALRRKAGSYLTPEARLCDLESVPWAELKRDWGGSPADWNHLRRALSVLLSTIMGDKFHPFRRRVMQAIPRASEGSGRVPDLTADKFWRIVDGMPEYARSAPVVLVLTGMRLGEYMRTDRSHLNAESHSIAVPGTKTAESAATVYVDARFWHWIDAGVPAPLKEGWLRRYWKRACEAVGVGDVRLHDLRHCHAQWAVAQGVPEPAVQVALRHATPEMTRRYTRTRDKGEVARAVADMLLQSPRSGTSSPPDEGALVTALATAFHTGRSARDGIQ